MIENWRRPTNSPCVYHVKCREKSMESMHADPRKGGGGGGKGETGALANEKNWELSLFLLRFCFRFCCRFY